MHKPMLQVVAFTPGASVPSSRFRVRQYIPLLRSHGIAVREEPARWGSYPPSRRWLRAPWAVAALAERMAAARRSLAADVTLLQREMISTLATVERWTKAPRILDVDDAIWLMRGGRAAAALARSSEMVICGNEFIAGYFRAHTPRVAVLPTAVDTCRFRPAARVRGEFRTVCWSGMSSGFGYLEAIAKPLAAVLGAAPHRRLRVVSDARPNLPGIPAASLEFRPWSEATEVESIQDADVGIMPLDDSLWARGKCGYKLLLYMACGLPVVGTPAGMSAQLFERAGAGLAARTPSEWIEALEYLLSDERRAGAIGAAGRAVVEREYSLAALAPRLAELIYQAANG